MARRMPRLPRKPLTAGFICVVGLIVFYAVEQASHRIARGRIRTVVPGSTMMNTRVVGFAYTRRFLFSNAEYAWHLQSWPAFVVPLGFAPSDSSDVAFAAQSIERLLGKSMLRGDMIVYRSGAHGLKWYILTHPSGGDVYIYAIAH